MRPALVPGRWPGASIAAPGVLLTLPALVWPVVVTTTFAEDDYPHSGPSSTQALWSWGKYSLSGCGQPTTSPPYEMSNTLGLVCLVVSLVVGAVSVAAWALLAGEPGRALGVDGTAFLTAAQLVFVAQWLGQRQSGWNGENAWTLVEQESAGWLQLASTLVLLVALGWMLWRPLRPGPAPRWRRLTGGAPEATVVPEGSRDGASSPHPIGQTRVREADDAGEPSRPLEGPRVGFFDEGADGDRTGGSEPSG